MIDMHTHVLPNIDDGAKDVEESVQMLQNALSQGIKTVVATSHYYGKQRSPQKYLQLRSEAYEKLKPYIPDGLNVVLGAEVHFTEDNSVSHEQICSLAIEGTKYVLLEFDFMRPFTDKLFRKLSDFLYETDYTPIIAHVDRYPSIYKKPKILTDLIKMGCLLQVNAEAFLEKRTKSLAFAMLKKGYVHCIGSDMHDTENRAENFEKMLEEIKKENCLADFEETKKWSEIILKNGKIKAYSEPPVRKFFHKYY